MAPAVATRDRRFARVRIVAVHCHINGSGDVDLFNRADKIRDTPNAISTHVKVLPSTISGSRGLRSIISCAIRRSARLCLPSMIRTPADEFCFPFSFGSLATSRDRFKDAVMNRSSFYLGFGSRIRFHANWAMFHDPISNAFSKPMSLPALPSVHLCFKISARSAGLFLEDRILTVRSIFF
jgi:hypothetical protein